MTAVKSEKPAQGDFLFPVPAPSYNSRTQGYRDLVSELSERELDVLICMAKGMRNSAIADCLFLVPRTVERHITSIFAKLDVSKAPELHSRVFAVLKFQEHVRIAELRRFNGVNGSELDFVQSRMADIGMG